MKKVYIAGPLYNEGERWYLEKIDEVVQALKMTTFLPHRDVGICPSDGDKGSFFFNEDVKMICQCDALIAVLNGTDVDSGTSWEIGYAFSRGIPIWGICDDTRVGVPKSNINLMIFNSVVFVSSIEQLHQELKLWLEA